MKYKLLYEKLRKRKLQAGELIFSEGDPGDYAYIIEEGAIEIWTEIDGQRLVLNVLSAGSMFGELALVDGRTRSASATAKGDVLLTLMTQEQVNQRIQSADPILRMLLLVAIRYFRSETEKLRHYTEEQITSYSDPRADLEGRISEAVEMIRMESELRTAIDEEQFTLLYQPVIHLERGQIVGFEALIRWQSPTRGLVRPDLFIPLAESTSLIVPIGQWVIAEGVRALQEIESVTGKQMFVNLNIANRQIEDPDFFEFLLEETRQVQPSQIKLEILERSLFDSDAAIAWVRRCRSLGFPLVLDDFGTGYSSLQYLNKYRFDTIKIDKSFIWGLDDKANSRSICQAIVDLSHALGMTVVAEGVEKSSHVNVLREIGCSFGQGYFFAKPMPLENAIALLDNPPFSW
ncbi:MAG: EAL domain-containing protein [Hormoscilla sp. GM7CHS1pb]|nr:EAL domain-containing protein [Hormoscilla sp. GM7CHS1pb]